ncbi:MAG: protein kinase [Planctomycetes bacterium]|nr:protein kinase [Planctomycetota bacterium]
MSERQVGPFTLQSKLGAGAMGVVYRARYDKTGQIVALKILPAELLSHDRSQARFEREMDILKKLKHPNIVRYYGGGKHAEHPYFAMELVEGGSLSALLSRRGRLPSDLTIEYGLQICAALEHAHTNGIIHRDLKPSNLLLAKDGTLKLADFGLARDVDATGLTATGKTMGTFAYMAPEQIRGVPPATHKADLYALGCVMFEMLSGRPPFVGDSPARIFYQHLEAKPPRVASIAMDCPVWLDSAVAQLLEKDPQKRPLDALAVAQTLREVEQRILSGASAVQQSVAGGPSTVSVITDTAEVRKLVGRKKRKRTQKGPFYEQTWFLGACLGVVIAVIAWTLWPMSEQKLFERASALMATSDQEKWLTAEDRYLKPLQRRFPNGQYAEQVQQYVDQIAMYRAEAQFKLNRRLRRDSESEAERLFEQAWKFEDFGDRVTALEKYRSMTNLLKDRENARPFVNLARRQIAQLEGAGVGAEDRIEIVNEALAKADRLYAEGQNMEARKIWESILTLYESNREMEPQVERARARKAGRTEEKSSERPPPADGQTKQPDGPPTPSSRGTEGPTGGQATARETP